MTPQRELGTAVVACLAGAGLSLYAAFRDWSVQVTERPGLTPLRSVTTGASHAPWLVGLALVALAGAGALLATRGLARRILGGLLIIIGAGLIVAAITGRAGLDAGTAATAATFWSIVCVLSGAIIAAGGLTAARHGHLWPAMSSRYERRQVPLPTARPAATQPPPAAAGLKESPDQGPDAQPPAGEPTMISTRETRDAWDALDRGDDPTLR